MVELFEKVRKQPREQVSISSNSDKAKVSIKERYLGIAPINLWLPIGNHEIKVQIPTGEIKVEHVEVTKGKSKQFNVQFGQIVKKEPKKAKRLWTWIVAGSAVAAGIVSIGVGSSFLSHKNDAKFIETMILID